MRSLPFLDEPLPPGDGEGLATHDPRFARVTRLADGERIAEAADAAAELIDENIYDIRLLIYIVHAAFIESGVQRLAELFSGLDRLLSTSRERIGPKERRDLHIDKSLAWLFDRIEIAISYRRAKQDRTWMGGGVDAMTDSLHALEKLVDGRHSDSRQILDEPSAKLRRLIRELLRETETPTMVDSDAPSPAVDRRDEAGPPMDAMGLDLIGSARFQDLLAKLHAFDVLVRQGDFRKASLVAADVQAIIDDFDPREYFPKLFARFSTLLSEHVDRIAPHWEKKDTLGWRMLEQFYRVDLDAFVGPKS